MNVHEAKTQLSKLRELVEAGEEVVVARAGRPVARLIPVETTRRLGVLDGRFLIPDDFNAPLPDDVLESFMGGAAPASIKLV